MKTIDAVCFTLLFITSAVWAQPASLISAVTQDSSGNGYLDHIILHFDKPTSFPATAQIAITAQNGKYALPVASVRGRTSSTDTVFVVTLVEPKNGDPAWGYPETGWKPNITITGLSGASPIVNFPATDGAGPVIWSIVKLIYSVIDRSQDKLTVMLSEPIGTGGNAFSLGTQPQNVFRVWKDSAGAGGKDTLVEVKGMLDSILAFYQMDNDSTVSFYMTNGKDMLVQNYLSLVSDTSVTKLTDKDPPLVNSPVANNQRVDVKFLCCGAGLPPETPEPSNRNCGCGSGTGLAFLPPVGFKLASLFRKRKREDRR